MDFINKLKAAWDKNDSLLCVGLDPNIDMLPHHLRDSKTPFSDFNKAIVDATADLVCSFKPNSAFYEARGAAGIEELKETCDYIRENYPDVPIILDFKRGDIGNTNKHYTKFAFDYLQVDAVTVQPYQGRQAVQPFLDCKNKGIMVLCRTSNVGSDEFQDMLVDGQKLYVHVAEHIRDEWNTNGNCQLVVGATYPKELAEIRALVGDEMVFLVPGFGAQGGETEATVQAGITSNGNGLIINSSREIIYSSDGEDFAEAARKKATASKNEINTYREKFRHG
jgi:orotidine-5'-phosphate decarboxylase